MRFTKMHGLGNDYVYVDCRDEDLEDPAGVARAVSDRHLGIGADGLILIRSSEVADVGMEMYNADGSRGRVCGNGLRCVAKYAVDHGLAGGPDLLIETDDGVRIAECQISDGEVRQVRVDMGAAVLAPSALPCTIAGDRIVDHPMMIDGKVYGVTCVSMGNPHAVVFVDDISTVELSEIGPAFEHAPEFPQRVNAHFVKVVSRERVTMKTWERGSGATQACGTGACAVCVAGALTERTGRSITAGLPGGDLKVEWSQNDHVYLVGPAVEVFSGVWPAQ